MDPIPLPPYTELPDPTQFQMPQLPPPVVKMPSWVTVPIKPEDVIPLPNTKTGKKKEKEKEKSERDEQADRLDEVDRMMTPTPQFPNTDIPLPSAEIKRVEVPFTNLTIPVPKEEIVATAVTTAGAAAIASVGATMFAGKLFSQIVKIAKPVIKAVLKKVAKVRGKPAPETWARQQLKESRLRKLGKTGSKGGS